MRERAKSGSRTKKAGGMRGEGEKEKESGDYRQPIVKKSARPLVASVF